MTRSTMAPQAAFITFTLPSSLYVAIIRTGCPVNDKRRGGPLPPPYSPAR